MIGCVECEEHFHHLSFSSSIFLFFLVSIWLSGIQNHLGDTHTKFDTKLIRLAFLMGTVSSIVVSTKRDETCTNEWRRRAVQKPFGPFLPPGRTREGDQDRASVSVVPCFENGDEKSDGEGTKQRRRRPILVVTLLLSPSLRSAAASFLASLRACIATLRVAGSTASFAAPCTCACANLLPSSFLKIIALLTCIPLNSQRTDPFSVHQVTASFRPRSALNSHSSSGAAI